MKEKKSIKTYIWVALMASAVLLGAWFALSPILMKQAALNYQEELLKSMEDGDADVSDSVSVNLEKYDVYTPIYATKSSINGSFPVASRSSSTEKGSKAGSNTSFPAEIKGIGILAIESIDLKLPVVDGVSDAQLKVAVGCVPQTAEIGAVGNAVIAGHRSYSRGKFFNRLDEVAVGDVIEYAPISGVPMSFEVYEILTVEPGDQAAFVQPQAQADITLLTCTPVRVASHRLLVRAKRIDG